MSPNPADPLVLAFEAAAGRAPSAGVAPALLAFARRVLAAGRRAAVAPRCPTAARRRAEALAAAAPRGRLARVLALVFDSFAAPLPALRGGTTPRLLRFAGDGGPLDVEIEVLPGGRRRLRVAAPRPAVGATLEARVRSPGGERRVPLDDAGVGAVVLPARVSRVQVVLCVGRRRLARTPDVDLD